MSKPLMSKATAVWLVDNTTLSFAQIADFCGMHELEVQGIADGDVATYSLDVGAGSAFNIKDDGPVITSASVASIDTLTVDETSLSSNATANFADNFSTAISYGADGAGSTAYSLVLTGTNVNSGLYTLGAGGAQGNQIVLNQSGNTITGSYGGTNYFTISIDNSTGVVTLDQLAAIYHASTASSAPPRGSLLGGMPIQPASADVLKRSAQIIPLGGGHPCRSQHHALAHIQAVVCSCMTAQVGVRSTSGPRPRRWSFGRLPQGTGPRSSEAS